MADDALASLLGSPIASHLIQSHAASLSLSTSTFPSPSPSPPASSASSALQSPSPASPSEILPVALAALAAFLQANVTGPVLPAQSARAVETLFADASRSGDETHDQALRRLRRACLAHLEVDGVCPYAHIPRLELFSLARFLVESITSPNDKEAEEAEDVVQGESLAWTRLRVDAWHYKILTQPSLGGSNFNKSAQWIDVPSLATKILEGIDVVRGKVLGADRGLFLVEAASHYISLGRRDQAKEALGQAVGLTGFTYALTGALGKRTRFQENDISQLVVLAKSADHTSTSPREQEKEEEGEERPDAVPLNDDTLLEEILFAKDKGNGPDEKEREKEKEKEAVLPPALAALAPDDQPQLDPLDAMVLLAEATIKDAFSPSDGLTAEQILPFASRVIADKAVNWQIYTQALLVRSRFEAHRSRTVERGVLQLQAVADQVIADTTSSDSTSDSTSPQEQKPDLPVIRVSGEAAPVDESKPTTFLPAPKQSESAPAHVRLRYIHALSSPPRWHLEAELAYAWAGIGSMASALGIFKRLRLWAEVALCLASTAAARDDEGKASSGEEQARAVLRWRLFSRTNSPASHEPDDDEDISLLKIEDWAGPERSPPPPDAPRLWCILGDIESDPSHYERAWGLSKHRYARAQRSLGEHHVRLGQWPLALEAYRLATHANRMSPDTWGRLGDIALRLGLFEEAAQAFTRSIGTASDAAGGESARTWSNLGSALWSLYLERTSPASSSSSAPDQTSSENNEDEKDGKDEEEVAKDPSKLIRQALAAYKRGAAIAHDNWRIWDNVLTLSARIHPPPLSDMLLSLTHILRIRRSESALDVALLAALLQDAVLSKPQPSASEDKDKGLPRGSAERSVNQFFEDQVVPVITARSELWTLVARLRSWRGDHAGALDASEKAWRCALGSSAGGLVPGDAAQDWTSDQPAWEEVVSRTDELVSMLENWGPEVEAVGQRWKGKARSAVRSVMGRGRENWEGTEGWKTLEAIMEGLK